jgi:hypothetical protein
MHQVSVWSMHNVGPGCGKDFSQIIGLKNVYTPERVRVEGGVLCFSEKPRAKRREEPRQSTLARNPRPWPWARGPFRVK